jgi:hypothetical protein
MTTDVAISSFPLLQEPRAAEIVFEEDAIEVPAAIIALALDLETSTVQSLVGRGEVTSLCENGENEDTGCYRLTQFGSEPLSSTPNIAGIVVA